MLSCTRKLLEARTKYGIPTARKHWDAVLRRGYAEDALGSGRQSRQSGVDQEDHQGDRESAQHRRPQRFLIRRVKGRDDTTGPFSSDRFERSLQLDPHENTTPSKNAKPKIKKNLPGIGKPKPGPQPKTRWGTRELAKDAFFGVVTTSRPLATTIDELVKDLPQMPQGEASELSEDTVSMVLLMTPGLARHALDSTVPKTVVDRLQPSKQFGKKYITTTAIVDRLPTTDDEIEGAEGMAYMLFRNPPPAEDGDQVPFQGSAQKPGSLTFRMPRVQINKLTTRATVQNLQLPLSQTVFTTGLVSTMMLREYTRGGIEEPLELTSERKLESQTLQLPALPEYNSSYRTYIPLVPLTPFRKINYVMGNIIRKLSAQRTWEVQPGEEGRTKLIESERDTEQDVPASQDLEQAVSKYFEVLDLQPETVSVWALVIPKAADSTKISHALRLQGIHNILGADEAAISAAWDPKAEASKVMLKSVAVATRHLMLYGARLIKVLSGGGGWGKKAGLLSLDPDVQYSTRELRQDEGWNFDFDAPDDGTGAAVEAQKNQALGQIVKEGESIMFLLAPKLQNLPTTYPEVHQRDTTGSRRASELELSFGPIPSSIDEIARSPESDETPARIQHYPNIFGMLSEGGMALQFTPKKQGKFYFQSKIDVPFARIDYKNHFLAEGKKLSYYPDALKDKPAQGHVAHPDESSAKDIVAETPGALREPGPFREKAKVEQRTTPL
jgi:hypothetical protein